MTQRGVIASAQLMREARAPRSKASTGVCSRAHGKQAAPIIYKLSRNKAFFRPAFGTTTPSTGASVASSRAEGNIYRHFGTASLN